ncbi:hypothetical protein PI125_g15904 [Phytophthora idaei]|nr:hypothetical protein PI125_g15904 [Phytophthora idaei]
MARWWDKFKGELVSTTLTTVPTRRRSGRNSFRQKLRRLTRQQGRERERTSGAAARVASITDELDALSLDAARLRTAIAECKRARAGAHSRKLLAVSTYYEDKTTTQLFRRVSSQYQVNHIRRLDPVLGPPRRELHEKADILSDAWSPILQQQVPDSDLQGTVANWIDEPGEPSPERQGVARAFSEAEVAGAQAWISRAVR